MVFAIRVWYTSPTVGRRCFPISARHPKLSSLETRRPRGVGQFPLGSRGLEEVIHASFRRASRSQTFPIEFPARSARSDSLADEYGFATGSACTRNAWKSFRARPAGWKSLGRRTARDTGVHLQWACTWWREFADSDARAKRAGCSSRTGSTRSGREARDSVGRCSLAESADDQCAYVHLSGAF